MKFYINLPLTLTYYLLLNKVNMQVIPEPLSTIIAEIQFQKTQFIKKVSLKTKLIEIMKSLFLDNFSDLSVTDEFLTDKINVDAQKRHGLKK